MRQRNLVVMTDVDGCLLDRETYSHAEADRALDRLRRMGIPVALCSSKTRAELERLQQELGLSGPFIAENGGALFLPIGTFGFPLAGAVRRGPYDVVEFGKPRREVADVLRRVAAREKVSVVTFADLSVQGVADECGLSLPDARLAKLRDYDEPFRVLSSEPADRARLYRALRSAGLRCFSGGRFDHVTSGANKGLAAVFLQRCYVREWAEVTVVGLGDDANDVEMLKAVDVPVVVRQANGDATARLAERVRTARVTSAVGPAGWSEAVAALLDEHGYFDVPSGPVRGEQRAPGRPAGSPLG